MECGSPLPLSHRPRARSRACLVHFCAPAAMPHPTATEAFTSWAGRALRHRGHRLCEALPLGRLRRRWGGRRVAGRVPAVELQDPADEEDEQAGRAGPTVPVAGVRLEARGKPVARPVGATTRPAEGATPSTAPAGQCRKALPPPTSLRQLIPALVAMSRRSFVTARTQADLQQYESQLRPNGSTRIAGPFPVKANRFRPPLSRIGSLFTHLCKLGL
jgi:hypothetical protein